MNPRAKLCLVVLLLLTLIAARLVSVGTFDNERANASNGTRTFPLAQDFPPPPTKITNALATIPSDTSGTPIQGNLDLYSWLTFVALNWPANTESCGANINQTILSGSGPVVWETYLEDSEVFVAPNSRPSVWCPQSSLAQRRSALLATLPVDVQKLAEKTGVRKVLIRQSKASSALGANFPGIEEAVGGVLTDQNGRFVRYEVRMNQDEYGYLTNPHNNLWNKTGQDSYTSTISFPTGPSSYGCVGAMEIKAAWKVLTQREILGKRFYMTQAIVFNDDAGNPSPGANPVWLGLVGLHIAHKTRTQTDWIWSTFEHVDNLKPPPGSPAGAKASFTNPGCSPGTCPPNVQTAATPATELDKNGKPLNKPVQVVRVNPIGDSTADHLNAVFQKLLMGSVWANYKLISTQWVGEDGTLPKPAFMANMVLETFIQMPKPPSDGPIPYPSPGYNPFAPGVASSSCMKCHSVATTASGKAKADFSFIMGEAQ